MTCGDGPETVLGRLLARVGYAGADAESDTPVDGFLSYHAETHAAGVGLGVGLAAAMTGDYRFIGALLAVAFGLNRGKSLLAPDIVKDIRDESPYALAGFAAGCLLGLLARDTGRVVA